MLLVEEAVRHLLINDVPVYHLVDERIFPQTAPEGTGLPYILYDINSTDPLRDQDGATGMTQTTIQIDCHAATHTAARQLAHLVRTALDDYASLVVVGEDSLLIHDINQNDESKDQVQRLPGADDGSHVAIMMFDVWHDDSQQEA